MSRKLSFYFLIFLATICIFFLALNQRYSNYLEHRLQPILSDAELRSRMKYQELFTVPTTKYDDPFWSYIRGTYAMESVALVEIADVVEQQRRIIQKEMEDYVYPNGKYDVYANKLDDLVIEKQGNPLRSVILTTWRSGSTFLGDILNSHPANFYHYEPLLHFGIIQIRDPPLSDEALENLDSMFKCDYSSLERYLSFGRNSHPWVFNHNTYLWKQCQLHKRICWDNRFVTKFCKLFPFQSMKIVRLRLQPMEKFLEQNELGVKIVLLIRDPRGVLQSRKHRDWCPSEPDCFDPTALCSDMVSDYNTAARFSKLYPNTFRVIRYEDLSVDPYSHTEKLFEFYGLHFHENVQRFLDTHTKTDIGGLSSTFRNSKAAPFHWRNDLDFEEVEEIQQECNLAMKLWGYVFALNETHQRYFDPVTNYSLRDSEA
ncbi:PREDICTED: carbohydrate sulfotransferase 4-like isoform X3 [Ceratosolen solmsi marchali]|uniref:Carbohydrate sulfotransferase 4-like isoform X3 n=2 Tax=Ceratosolen solmsi marchali TaxID=326594 RepID=A0AAJ6YP86_9HYME|nr:PREDICTED: carbohydrate sulfotransferase 4-like isoform X3 [Ceratosolen solmsi marchali]XP_011501741.1 PREDICTED: carbohydrate sulfotransferase 4-like isoform X3 [Ceratosolen solmsi marchali]XP_011501742.1 PREDICTED: carbohydrate sulfotransferase 4-like isoform X3 [Ceratosolen solmsi marchali]XP_011501743.1 PREDICTED: carbohydrate sulfotransferase 4-like isoform X3 [Ceratosolen solmsi marchali]